MKRRAFLGAVAAAPALPALPAPPPEIAGKAIEAAAVASDPFGERMYGVYIRNDAWVALVEGEAPPDVDYETDTALHPFEGEGSLCDLCGEHRNWHPEDPE